MLDGFRAQVPDGWTVTHARGADILTLGADPRGRVLPRRPAAPAGRRSRSTPDAALIAEAVAAARGRRRRRRGRRRPHRARRRGPVDRDARARRRAGRPARRARRDRHAAGRRAHRVASRSCCRRRRMNAAAIIWAANPGMRGGPRDRRAGARAGSSRRAACRSRSREHVGQQPTYYNQIRGQHGDAVRRPHAAPCRSRSARACPTRPSSTRTCRWSSRCSGVDDTVRAHVTLHNTGDRPARETVQVYVRDTVTSVTWADKELKTYRQVDVAPGERVVVDLDAARRGLHARRRERPPDRRAGEVRAAGGPVVARRGAAPGGLRVRD